METRAPVYFQAGKLLLNAVVYLKNQLLFWEASSISSLRDDMEARLGSPAASMSAPNKQNVD
jgi:hypothetical protein